MTADALKRVIAFCAGRYNELRDTRPPLARAYLGIINQARELELSSADPERDLLDWLSKSQTDPDQARACKEVIEQLGNAP